MTSEDATTCSDARVKHLGNRCNIRAWLNSQWKPRVIAKNRKPMPSSSDIMGRVSIDASRQRGLSSITLCDGGSETRAIDGKK